MTAPLAVSAHPNLTSLPGSNVLQQLVNGAEAWALAVALLGAFIGAAPWAVASQEATRVSIPRWYRSAWSTSVVAMRGTGAAAARALPR
mgnify:CR=1 FL=1